LHFRFAGRPEDLHASQQRRRVGTDVVSAGADAFKIKFSC
jgi:hypothetical protein